jgi:amidohydrolase
MITDYKHLINIRQSLHQNPELSGFEEFTSEALKRTIIRYQPDEIIDNLGGFGVAFVFKGKTEGPCVLFRAEMDALPVHEINNHDYVSRTDGIGHQCGHDGHMAIMIGLAELIGSNRPKKGRVVLLFQPAEETGEGAIAVINDSNFSRITPDFCFSLHNIPGYPKGSILLKSNTFTAASQGIIVKLTGKTSHAAEPDKGISPAIALSLILDEVTKLPEKKYLFNDFVLTTIVHANLGDRSFGTTPGHAEILITLRSFKDADMDILIKQTINTIEKISEKEKLQLEISITDVYPSTQNNSELVNLVNEQAEKLGYNIIEMEKPFPWAEDFAQFSQKYKSAIFGLGAGENHPILHNSDYNFPDEIIPYGVNLFFAIYKDQFLK